MHFVYSKQWGKMDYRIWLSLIVLAFISLTLLGYKVATDVKCPDFVVKTSSNINHINEKPNTYFVNEQIRFSSLVQDDALIVTWDFGDKSARTIGSLVAHSFLKEGSYLVTAMVNGKCVESINIHIVQNATYSNEINAPAISPIVANDGAAAGTEMEFNTTAASASYEWSIKELPDLGTIKTKSARFLFTTPGNYTVFLKVDNGQSFQKPVQITDAISNPGSFSQKPPDITAPPPPIITDPMPPKQDDNKEKNPKPAPIPDPQTPPEKVYDQLPEPAVKQMLEDVIESKKDIKEFDNILCNGAGTKVVANGEATTFAALCNVLKEKKGFPFKKKKKIESVKLSREPAKGNCVYTLYVNYK